MVVATDIGGTFTDVVFFDGRRLEQFKVLSTPTKPEKAVEIAYKKIGEKIEKDSVKFVLHATTIATNLFLGQKKLQIPPVALITTEGFEDIIEIGRQKRPELYNLRFEKPKIPLRYKFGVKERTDANGKVLISPSQKEIMKIAKKIYGKVKAVAVCFLNSWKNPENERKVAEILKKELDAFVVTSHEIDPQFREYERFSTTVINAILMPVVTTYLAELEKITKENFPRSRFFVMQSGGGVATPEVILRKPSVIVESGPSAGAVAVRAMCMKLKVPNAISFDMGGTTAKVSVIKNYELELTTEYEIGGRMHSGRLTKGSGLPVRQLFVDLAEVSAGGGTIVKVGEENEVIVGPESAGADPGPVCYRKGGTEPTVTDANLVLGRLPEKISELYLDREKALVAFEKLAQKIEKNVFEFAEGVLRIINHKMAGAIRVMTVERGLDPRKFTLIAFGGAGPLHACELADMLRITKVIIPTNAGTFSALGLVMTKAMAEESQTVFLEENELHKGEKVFRELERKITEKMKSSGFEKFRTKRFFDARFKGQSWEVKVEFSGWQNAKKDFLREYRRLWSFADEKNLMQVVTLRVVAEADFIDEIPFPSPPPAKTSRKTRVFFNSRWQDATFFEGAPESCVGPAIISLDTSTVFVPPHWRAKRHKFGIELSRL